MRITEYMVPVLYDGEVPPEILIAVKTSDIDKVKKAWKNANNPFALARNTIRGEADIVGKPSTVYITQRSGTTYYVLRYPAGNVYVQADKVSEELNDVIQSELLYITVTRRGNAYIATEVQPLISVTKEERGKELVEVAESDGINIWEMPLLGYGYVTMSTKSLFNSNAPNENLARIALLINLRFMSTVKVNGQVLHTIELTSPNTGKTTFAVRNVYLLNWSYIDEAPSYAKLIMDARNGALGVVFRSNGVFIDEIDKYDKDLKDVIHVMLTGMSHGLWTRGKGDKDAPNIKRMIPIYLAGNKLNRQLVSMSPRSYIYDVLSTNLSTSMLDPLLDRIAIVITNNELINASDYVSRYVISDSYLRGFIAYINKLVSQKYKDIAVFTGRRREQANIVYAICEALYLERECVEFAKRIEQGFEV